MDGRAALSAADASFTAAGTRPPASHALDRAAINSGSRAIPAAIRRASPTWCPSPDVRSAHTRVRIGTEALIPALQETGRLAGHTGPEPLVRPDKSHSGAGEAWR